MNGLIEVEESNAQVKAVDNSPMALVSAAVNSGADVDKLEKLMDLQERWEKKEAKKSFYKALAKFQSVCPDIIAKKQGHNSKYAPIGDIVAQIKQPLSESGLTYRFEQAQNEKGVIKISCIISHFDGHEERTSLSSDADKSGNKQAIQAIASTVTYLRRYTLTGALGIATADEDMDGRLPGVETIDDSQQFELFKLLCDPETKQYTDKGLKVRRAFKFTNINEIPSKNFDKILKAAQR